MTSNWTEDLEQEINEFIGNSTPLEREELLLKANVDHFNAIGAPLDARPEDVPVLVGTGELVLPMHLVSLFVPKFDFPAGKIICPPSGAGTYEEMPLAA